METKKGTSIYRKLARRFLLLLLVVSFVQTAFFWFLGNYIVDRREQIVNRALAAKLKDSVLPELQPGKSFHDLMLAVGRVYSINPKLSLFIIDREGKILANLGAEESIPITHVDIEPVRKFLEPGSESSFPIYGLDPSYFRRRAIFSATPITYDGQEALLYVVLATFKSNAIDSLSTQTSGAFLSAFMGILSFTSAGAVGIALLYLLTKRLRRLTSGVERFSQGDMTARVETGPPDEIGFLAETFNQMAESLSQNITALEERDRIRRDLIADVSHDLRGPVAVMQSYVKRLTDSGTEQDTLSRTVEILAQSLRSLQALLSQLFDLAKFEAKERRVQPIPLHVSEFFSALESAFTPKAEELEITLALEAPEALPRVSADPMLLERVLSNLVENALRYTPAGGRVTIRGISDGEHVRVEIADTGRGLSKEEISRLGSKYFQAHGEAPRTGESSGLGLSIVKHIIEGHGSELEIRSTPGEGSTFAFRLRIVR